MSESQHARGWHSMTSSAWIALPALFVISTLMVWSHYRYGSVKLGLAATVGGRELAVENPTRSFGTLDVARQGFATFTLLNSSGRPITLVGAKANLLLYIGRTTPGCDPGSRATVSEGELLGVQAG